MFVPWYVKSKRWRIKGSTCCSTNESSLKSKKLTMWKTSALIWLKKLWCQKQTLKNPRKLILLYIWKWVVRFNSHKDAAVSLDIEDILFDKPLNEVESYYDQLIKRKINKEGEMVIKCPFCNSSFSGKKPSPLKIIWHWDGVYLRFALLHKWNIYVQVEEVAGKRKDCNSWHGTRG